MTNKNVTGMPRLAIVVAIALSSLGCQSIERRWEGPVAATPSPPPETSIAPGASAPVSESIYQPNSTPNTGKTEPIIIRGTEPMVGRPRAKAGPEAKEGDITLNFSGTSLPEVLKVIFTDILKENYILEPGVSGTVTMQTSHPITRDQVLPTLEALLQVNGAALLHRNGTYRIVPLATATTHALPPRTSDAGFRTQVVPLRYIGVQEAQKLLQPFLNDKILMQTEPARNLLVLSGANEDLRSVLDTIDIFDVDWLKGMSVGLFPLAHAEAQKVVKELETVFGKVDAPSGILRVTAVDQLNAVLVVTPQPAYLDRAREWIDRLDKAGNQDTQQLYVYHVQNGKAVDLAAALNGILGGQGTKGASLPPPTLAPGLASTELQSPPPSGGSASDTGGGSMLSQPQSEPQGPAVTVSQAGHARVIADTINNALLIMATPRDYDMILAALKHLDITPMQVLIEASIIEVSLTHELSYGLEWFFKNHLENYTGKSTLDLGTAGLSAITPGFSYAIIDSANQVRVALNALASKSKVNVLSSPSLMVLNNGTAKINVGDEVPVPTRQSQSNLTPDAPTVNEIEYRNTGVLLTVTPRVNSNGLVTMDVAQEVTDVTSTTSSTLNAPTFNQRAIQSTVAVQSGDTIVLGGLIRNNNTDTNSGVPLLYRLPLVGKLFGQTTDNTSRTELLVLITPRAVQSRDESLSVTRELEEKLRALQPTIGTHSN